MNDNPTHVIYSEFVGPDRYVTTKVPLNHIKFLDKTALEHRISNDEQDRFTHYCDLIRNGHHANGLPIVYRTPKGVMFASDLRFSDIAIYAEQNTKVLPGVPRNPIHPLISVKIIEVANRADIDIQRAIYLERHR